MNKRLSVVFGIAGLLLAAVLVLVGGRHVRQREALADGRARRLDVGTSQDGRDVAGPAFASRSVKPARRLPSLPFDPVLDDPGGIVSPGPTSPGTAKSGASDGAADEPEPSVDAGSTGEAPSANAQESRREILDSFAASGEAKGTWKRDVDAILSDLRKSVPASLASQIQFSRFACYEKGCTLDVAYRDLHTFDEAAPTFFEVFDRWPGSKGRTTPDVADSGRVKVTWLLLNPSNNVF